MILLRTMKDSVNLDILLTNTEQTAASSRTGGFAMVTSAVLAALRDGAPQAFDTVYLCCHEPVLAFFRLLLHNDAEAEELCQELFIRLWENHGRIDPDLNFRSYLYTVAKSSAMKYFRHKQVQEKYVTFRLHQKAESALAPDSALIGSELSLLVRSSLEKMPEQRRKVFEMSRFGSLTNGEIAERLNIRESTVRTHLHHALKALKEMIGLFVFL